MSLKRSTTSSTTSSTIVRVIDHATHGLTLAHLRAFVAECDTAGFDDALKVRLTDDLSATSHWHTVQLTASISTTTPDNEEAAS